MGRNTDYQMPSGEILPPSLSEIEQKYINREIKEERKQWEWVMIALGVLVLLLLTWVYFQVPTVQSAHAQEAPVSITRADYEFDVFCTQAVKDHKQLHEKLTGNLKEVCGAYE